MDFFIVKNYEGKRRCILVNAVDTICENNPRRGETKIILRSGAVIVTCEKFDDVVKKCANATCLLED